jgi:FkbM family methyltransferase
MIKIILRKIINLYISVFKIFLFNIFYILSSINIKFAVVVIDITSTFLNNLKRKVIHKTSDENLEINLFTPSQICLMRANTFSTKEPETLQWIEEFGGKTAILFDIGANVGLYSLYHCLLNNGKSYAFEPSVFNLKQLLKNINENNCQNKIVIISNPLFLTNGIDDFTYSTVEEGGSMSTFGVEYGFDGNKLDNIITSKVLGFSLDFLISSKLINDTPDLLKMDVDGIEHIILNGAIETISSNKLKSILVEVNKDFKEQESEVHKILNKCGFRLRKKYMSEPSSESSKFNNTGNEIWVKQ